MTDIGMLVDGTNLLMRAVHASANSPDPMEAKGIPTGPAHIFATMLGKYVGQIEPTHLVVAWDSHGGSPARRAIDPAYKEARKGSSTEAHSDSWALATVLLDHAGVAQVALPDFEADDIIGHFVRHRPRDMRQVIVSGDKDFLHLLGSGWVEQVRPGSAEERWTRSRVRSDMGCTPDQLLLCMALTGDAIDGILGVPRVGHKTAVKLLAAHDWSLEALLSSDEKKIAGHRALVERNIKLIDLLHDHVGITAWLSTTLPTFRPTTRDDPSWEPLMNFLDTFEFRRLRQAFESNTQWRL